MYRDLVNTRVPRVSTKNVHSHAFTYFGRFLLVDWVVKFEQGPRDTRVYQDVPWCLHNTNALWSTKSAQNEPCNVYMVNICFCKHRTIQKYLYTSNPNTHSCIKLFYKNVLEPTKLNAHVWPTLILITKLFMV